MNNLTLAVQTIKDSISARDVGQALGLEVRRGRCRCPIHGGTDFNCVLYTGNRGFYCHVCKTGGDVVTFVQQCNSLSFKEAVAWINDAFHMGLDITGKIDPKAQREAEIALQRRKRAYAFEEWKDRMRLNLALAADQIVDRLEDERDANLPRTPYEPWNADFCAAVGTLPDARRFAEDCMMDCVKQKCP